MLHYRVSEWNNTTNRWTQIPNPKNLFLLVTIYQKPSRPERGHRLQKNELSRFILPLRDRDRVEKSTMRVSVSQTIRLNISRYVTRRARGFDRRPTGDRFNKILDLRCHDVIALRFVCLLFWNKEAFRWSLTCVVIMSWDSSELAWRTGNNRSRSRRPIKSWSFARTRTKRKVWRIVTWATNIDIRSSFTSLGRSVEVL